MAKKKIVGKVHPAKTMFLRVNAGTAKSDGVTYELTTSLAGSPIVNSSKTGKYFTLSWEDICNLAIEAGIDK